MQLTLQLKPTFEHLKHTYTFEILYIHLNIYIISLEMIIYLVQLTFAQYVCNNRNVDLAVKRHLQALYIVTNVTLQTHKYTNTVRGIIQLLSEPL